MIATPSPKPLLGHSIDNSYFRAWATRTTHPSSTESVSPLTHPAVRRPESLAPTRGVWSDGQTLNVDQPRRPLVRPGLSNRNITHDGQTTSQRTSGVTPSLRPKYFRTGSMTETASRWSELTHESSVDSIGEPKIPQKDLDHCRLNFAARNGVKHDQNGSDGGQSAHWHNINVRHQRPSLGKRFKTETAIGTYTPDSPSAKPVAFELTTFTHTIHEQSERQSPESSLELPLMPNRQSESHKVKRFQKFWPKWFLQRTKQNIRSKSVQKILPHPQDKRDNSRTLSILKRASTTLGSLVARRKSKKRVTKSIADFTTTTTTPAPPNYSHHRYASSEGSHQSTSSPSRERHIRQPSLPTPMSAQWYTSTDNKQYRCVELSRPNAPAFLPSEATRLSTPPLPSSSASDKGRLRGYFFDFSAPSGPDAPMSRPTATKRTKASMHMRSSGASSDPVWFRVRVAGSEDPALGDEFDPNVPDHLPSSPLCPRHPKHTSGGTGNCAMHGRNREVEDEDEDE